jgi:hypothetical protein
VLSVPRREDVKLNARVTTMSNGNTVVIYSSPSPITEWEQQPILAEIGKEHMVESSMFLKYGVIVRVRDTGKTHQKGRRSSSPGG